MRVYKVLALIFIAIAFWSFTQSFIGDEWIQLFNGKDLTGWDTWIGPPLDNAGKMLSKTPVGLNNDPNHVFTIAKNDGENVIRISGENWGGISTKEEYENFHLQLMI